MSHTRQASVLVVLLAACDGGGADAPDAEVADCEDPTTALPAEFVPIDLVSGGAVSNAAAGTTTTLVDASAGGFGASDGEPFVYLTFDGTDLAKQALTDVDSYDDGTWDLAIKRYVFRTNGGDSGPGDVRVAVVSAASLDEVTAVPIASSFGVDDWATPACELVPDGLGAPLTAVGDWFVVDGGVLSPQPLVYVLALAGGEHVKLRIVSYYANPGDPAESAYFELEWARL